VGSVILNPDKVGTKDLVFGEIGFFAPAALRMTVVMNVILSPDFIGDEGSCLWGKWILRACGTQNDIGDERHPES